MAVSAGLASRQQLLAQASSDSCGIDLVRPTLATPHPITLEEIVGVREVLEISASPDGQQVAFLVRQAFLKCGAYRTALFVVDTGGARQPRKVLEEASLNRLRWAPDGRHVSVLSTKSGSQQLWRVSADGGVPEPVLIHTPGKDETSLRRGYHPSDSTPVGVLSYEWSPSGSHIAFTTTPPVDTARRSRMVREGIRYDDATMSSADLVTERWTREPMELWLYDTRSRSERLLWEARGEIEDLAWRPDGTDLAVTYEVPPVLKTSLIFFNRDLGLISVADGAFKALVSGTEAVETLPVWSSDGQMLAYMSHLDLPRSALNVLNLRAGTRREVARGKLGTQLAGLWWSRAGHELVFETNGLGRQRDRRGLYSTQVGGASPVRQTPDSLHMSGCSLIGHHRAVCIGEASMIPPAPTLVELGNGGTRTLAELNPQLAYNELSPVTELRWRNRYGAETNGYLIRPLRHRPGRRCPLLILAYGFEGKFVTQAEHITSYPAQVFAREGFAVLMVNYPRYDDWPGRNYERGSIAEGYSPVASLEAIVGRLTKEGLVDSTRIGMAGHSYGGFWTEFTLAHSRILHAASVTDGGGYNPGQYWFSGSHSLREVHEHVLAGPPYGTTLKNWIKFSPALNAHRVRAPVLMEFASYGALFGLEMFTALRRHDVPVEMIVYPNEGHIFTDPEHRLRSMQRNLDWFRFWLLGAEDADSSRREQYARWRRMRGEHPKARGKLRPSGPSVSGGE